MDKRFVKKERLLADIVSVASETGAKRLSYSFYKMCGGKHGYKTFCNYFGSWSNAVTLSGLKSCEKLSSSVIELYKNYEAVWDKLGAMPSMDSMNPRFGSICSSRQYVTKFGSWENFKAEFLIWADGRKFDPRKVEGLPKRKIFSKKVRFAVLDRDGFKCRSCGQGPPEHVLHVDHIIPRAKGGTDELSNLQTLCADCNLGKGVRVMATKPQSRFSN